MINLLVIDPQPIVRCVFKTFLADYDFLDVVHAVDDVDDAIEYIKSYTVDILFSEMSFTNVSPINLIGKVKSVNPDIYVIFLPLKINKLQCPLFREGAIGFLSKNINTIGHGRCHQQDQIL